MMHQKGMTDLSAGAIAYVRFVLEHHGLSPSALAKRAQISSSTLTRALNDPHHKFALSIKTLDKIALATGHNYARFLDPSDWIGDKYSQSPEAEEYRERSREALRRMTPIDGAVCAGLWMTRAVREERATGRFVDAQVCTIDPIYQIALWVEGPSCDLFASDRDLLICSRIDPNSYLFSNRALLCVERWRKDEDLVEITVRKTSVTQDSITFDLPTSDAAVTDKSLTVKRNDFSSIKPFARVHWIMRGIILPE